jgi:hypothetical protein
MQLDRRRFLGLLGAAVPLGIAACEAPTGELVAARAGAATDAGVAVGLDAGDVDARALADAAVAEDVAAPVDGAAPLDGGVLLDAGDVVEGDAGVAVVVEAPFSVRLYDPTCSQHEHGLTVAARAYAPGAVTRYLGGSHTVELSADEIARLAAGEVLPFASVGDGPNHGHCGLAFRADREPRELPAEVACVPRGTAMCLVR